MSRVFGRLGFNPRLHYTKDSKMVLDAALLITQHYKLRIKGKVEQSREWNSTLPYTFWLPSTKVAKKLIYTYLIIISDNVVKKYQSAI